jgi:hypothetical protein
VENEYERHSKERYLRGAFRLSAGFLPEGSNPIVPALVVPIRRKPRRMGQPFVVVAQRWASQPLLRDVELRMRAVRSFDFVKAVRDPS